MHASGWNHVFLLQRLLIIWVKIHLFCHTQTGPGIGIGNGQSDNPYNDPGIGMHR